MFSSRLSAKFHLLASSRVCHRLGAQCVSRKLSSSNDGSYGEAPPAGDQPPLPPYKPRVGENITQMKARLIYQSRKRGMLENGLLLSTFASRYLEKMTQEQLKTYDTLINKPSNDWDIYYWIIGREPTPAEYDTEVMKMLQDHAQNKEKEARIRQPDLY